MRIVSANIRHGRDEDGRAGDLYQVGRQLRGLGPDVVTLQEVDFRQLRSGGEDQLALIAQGLGWRRQRARMYCFFAGQANALRLPVAADPAAAAGCGWRRLVSASTPLIGGYGVALVSRHPVTSWRHMRLGAAAPRITHPGEGRGLLGSGISVYFGQNRGILAADLVVAGRRVRIGTTHLELGQRTARRQLFRAWSMLHRDCAHPTFLTGDFNLEAQVVQQVTGVAAAADATAKTFPLRAPRASIDHVLCPPAAVCRPVTVETVALTVGDHRALVVDVDFRADGKGNEGEAAADSGAAAHPAAGRPGSK